MRYPTIDAERTGKRIKAVCEQKGIRTKDIQEFMNFSTAQSVYDWFRGKSLPSLDNFYALARFFGMPMETLIVSVEQTEYELWAIQRKWGNRILVIYKNICNI